MTSDSPDNSRQGAGAGFLRGRRPGPLISSLAGVLVVAALVRLVERWMPALHNVLVPIYWIIGVIVFIVIARWLRGRHGNRRTADRRQTEHRETDV